MKIRHLPTCPSLFLSLHVRNDDNDTDTDTDTDAPDTYAFKSRFDDNSSVSYSGQVFRNLLIDDMKAAIGSLTDDVLADPSWSAGDARGAVYFYLDFDSDTSGDLNILKTAGDTPVLQMTYK